jgi:hypothetical protein
MTPTPTEGGNMSDDMGTFRIDTEIENPARPGRVLDIFKEGGLPSSASNDRR